MRTYADVCGRMRTYALLYFLTVGRRVVSTASLIFCIAQLQAMLTSTIVLAVLAVLVEKYQY
jgi:hypothetical protein